MTEPNAAEPPADEPQPEKEIWVYGGMRLNQNRAGSKIPKYGEWITGRTVRNEDTGAEEPELPWFAYSAKEIVGGRYEVEVTRRDGGRMTRHAARYLGLSEDEELRRELNAQDRAARTYLDAKARLAKDKADDPFEDLLRQMQDHIRRVPAPQRSALMAYVMYKLARTW